MVESRKAKGADGGLAELLDAAISGEERPLYDRLTRGSWLPGQDANLELAASFGLACVARGASSDRLIVRMALLDADFAPGGTELEFLPICGVAAVGARALADAKARPQLLQTLHDASEDLRWRVRAMVPLALAGVGAGCGAALIAELDDWLEGYFHAAALLLALADPRWLNSIPESEAAIPIGAMDRAFQLARGASRSASRYPGYKALIDALSSVPASLAVRFGAPVFEALTEWAGEKKDPILRELVEKNLEPSRLKSRFADQVALVRRALDASAPPRRDPRSYVGKTRGRGRKTR